MGLTTITPNIIEFQNCLPSGWAQRLSKIRQKCQFYSLIVGESKKIGVIQIEVIIQHLEKKY